MSSPFADGIERLIGSRGPQGIAAPAQDASPEKLKALAAQFESMLVGQMLKEMRSSMFDEDGESGSTMAPLADQLFAELSLAISRAGGVGLSDAMASPLSRQANPEAAVAALAGPALTAAAAGSIGSTGAPEPRVGSTLTGPVSSPFGWRKDPFNQALKFHKGMDIALPEGHELSAPQAAKVVFAGEQGSYGKTVVLDHGGGVTSRYAHLSEINVATGDAVAAGQVFGKVGSTGRATGAHLHLEVLEDGKHVNPEEKLATYAAGRPQ